MFWRRRGRNSTETTTDAPTASVADDEAEARPEAEDAVPPPDETGRIELDRDAPRPVAIQRAAEELSRRGDRVVELFKDVVSPKGRTNVAIHLKRGPEPEEDVFVEVATGPWDEGALLNAAKTAAVLRGSDHADATLEFLSAYPLPEEVRFFEERSVAAVFQLDLVHGDDLQNPEACAESFREAANRHWGLDLDYGPGELSLIEELLTTTLNEETGDAAPRTLDPLVHGLGCYVGETIRRHSPQGGSWHPTEEWGEEAVLELGDLTADPIGQARSFLQNGPEDSIAFYADYVLRELGVHER